MRGHARVQGVNKRSRASPWGQGEVTGDFKGSTRGHRRVREVNESESKRSTGKPKGSTRGHGRVKGSTGECKGSARGHGQVLGVSERSQSMT